MLWKYEKILCFFLLFQSVFEKGSLQNVHHNLWEISLSFFNILFSILEI